MLTKPQTHQKLIKSSNSNNLVLLRFIINLCVDSAIIDEDEPAMIALHFKTKFKHHKDGKSSVLMTCKRGPNGWEEVEEIDNTWIDDDGKGCNVLDILEK